MKTSISAVSIAPLGPLAAAIVTLGASACETTVDLDNARPRVTWVAVEAIAAGDAACPVARCARLTLWVADVEGDAVDVTARWSAGGASGDLALAPGSYPLVGLPTRTAIHDAAGAPHMVLWDLADVPEGAVTLELTTDDRPFDRAAGDVYTTPAIDPRSDVAPVEATRQ